MAMFQTMGGRLCMLTATGDILCRKLCHAMIDEHGIDHFRPVTGLPISTYFSAFKVKWMLDNVPEVQMAFAEGDAMIGTVDSWLIYNLTGGVGKGVHVTDGMGLTLRVTCQSVYFVWAAQDTCVRFLGRSVGV